MHKWPLGGTVYTIAIHIHSGKINSSCPYKFIEFQLWQQACSGSHWLYIFHFCDEPNWPKKLIFILPVFIYSWDIFFRVKSGTCQSRKQPKKFKVNFRKWHVSKLNLIFSLSRSVTKAPVSRLIKNSTQETYLHFISIHLQLGFFFSA